MSKDMCARNRPKSNKCRRLTRNGWGAAGVPPESAPEGSARRPRRSSRPALRRFFAPGTPASAAAAPGGSGGLPAADVDELAATLGRPSRPAGVVTVDVAAAAPAAGPANPFTPPPGGPFSVWR